MSYERKNTKRLKKGTFTTVSAIVLLPLALLFINYTNDVSKRDADFPEDNITSTIFDAEEDVEVSESVDNSSEYFNACEVLESTVPAEPRIIIHVARKGDTLSSIWSHYTLNTFGAMRAAEALKKVKVPLSSIKHGDDIELQISSGGDITALRKKLDKGRLLLLNGDSFRGYSPKIIEPVYKETERVVSGIITNSLAKDAYERGVPYEVIDSYVDLLANDIDFKRDLRRGDTYSVSFSQQETEDGEIINVGPIDSASIVVKGKLHVAIGYTGKDKKRHYYDENGNAIGDYFLRYPLKFTRISSVFSKARKHPILGIKRAHPAVDFAAPKGTPVRSIGSGRVIFAGYSGAAGNMIKIQHGPKYTTSYLHLSSFRKGIKNKVSVERGEVIGYVGSTGLSTGPHLDFRFAIDGNYVDPLNSNLPQLSSSTERIPQKILNATMAEIRQAHEAQHMLALHSEDKESDDLS